MGGWVSYACVTKKVEEIEAVRMRCCELWVCGWVGWEEVEERLEFLLLDFAPASLLFLGRGGWAGGWVGGWVGGC